MPVSPEPVGSKFASFPKAEKITESSFKEEIMSLNIHNNAASLFQFLDTSKSKVKPQTKLEIHDDFNSYMKKQEVKAHQRQFDNVEISRNHVKTKAHAYEPPLNGGNTINQQPPVTENSRAEEAIDPAIAKLIAQEIARIDRDFEQYHASLTLSGALHSLANAFRLNRGETTGYTENYEDIFGDLAKAYSLLYDHMKLRFEEGDYGEAVFNERLSILNSTFDRGIKVEAMRSADLAFRPIECGSLVPQEESLAIRYTDWGSAARGLFSLDLKPQNVLAQAAKNHSEIFVNNFLETFQQDGYDSAIAAAREAFMNIPVTTSTSDISVRDLSVIINAVNKGGFADFDDLKKSDLSDFMKEFLEDDWVFKQQSIREWNKEGAELLEERKKLYEQRNEIIWGSSLSEKEKEAQIQVIHGLMQVNWGEIFLFINKLPGSGNYRMYHL